MLSMPKPWRNDGVSAMNLRLRIAISLVAVGLIVAALLLTNFAVPWPASSRDMGETTPIRHLFVIMKENHAFDNYFGTFPGAEGIPPNVRLPDGSGGTIAPHWIESHSTNDLPHSRAEMLEAWNNGLNDGFAIVAARWGRDRAIDAMGYYDERHIPYYWSLARTFALADHYFQSMFGPSNPNRFFSFAGTNAGLETNSIADVSFDGLTIFDQLQAKGVSWRYYHEPNPHHLPLPLLFRTLASNPEAVRNVIPLDGLLADLLTGDLAQVTYIDPSDHPTINEHPPQNISVGETWTKTLIDAIMASSRWSKTAIFLTWDESGGFHDHVSPPQVDEWGYGFRVPFILVSPFAKRNWIDHTVMDHTSMLQFIARNWDLPPLTTRQSAAGDPTSLFDFPPVVDAGDRFPESLSGQNEVSKQIQCVFSKAVPRKAGTEDGVESFQGIAE